MFRFVIQWLLSAVAILFVSRVDPDFHVNGQNSAMIAAAGIGLLNAILGVLLKLINFPLAVLLFAFVLFAINTAMIEAASSIVPGFYIYGWNPALWGAAVVSSIGLAIRMMAKE